MRIPTSGWKAGTNTFWTCSALLLAQQPVRGWQIKVREKNAGVVSPPNHIQQDAENVCQHKKTVVCFVWLFD
jgi:hypothetical protein